MSINEKYNGYTNYETWSVSLIIQNDQGWIESLIEQAHEIMEDTEAIEASPLSKEDFVACRLADLIKDEIEELIDSQELPDVLSQLLTGAVSRVDWDEIAHVIVNDLG